MLCCCVQGRLKAARPGQGTEAATVLPHSRRCCHRLPDGRPELMAPPRMRWPVYQVITIQPTWPEHPPY